MKQTYIKLYIFLIFSIFFANNLNAEIQIKTEEIKQQTKYDYGNEYYYEDPNFFDFVLEAPKNFLNFFTYTFQKSHFPVISSLLITTYITERYDEELKREINKFSQAIEWSKKIERGSSNNVIIEDYLKMPKNLNSWMLQLGNPILHLGLGLSFAIYGEDNLYGPRPLQTSSQIVEALILDTLIVELSSRLITRERPYVSEEKKGSWHFSPEEGFGENSFDVQSFPALGITYFTSTMTIISQNYFEHQYIGTVSFLLGTVLSFASINAGLNWASDLPLSVAIGYASAKSIMNKKLKKDEEIYKYKPYYEINPIKFPTGGIGVALNYRF
jgi:hypothetical protein